MTYTLSESCSVLMSKFMRSPQVGAASLLVACRRCRSAGLLLSLEALERLLGRRRQRVVRRKLQELLVRRDRRLRVAGALGHLCEPQLRRRVLRAQLREPLVGADGIALVRDDLLVRVARLRPDDARDGRLDRVRDARER